jgi:hypothetical protein
VIGASVFSVFDSRFAPVGVYLNATALSGRVLAPYTVPPTAAVQDLARGFPSAGAAINAFFSIFPRRTTVQLWR